MSGPEILYLTSKRNNSVHYSIFMCLWYYFHADKVVPAYINKFHTFSSSALCRDKWVASLTHRPMYSRGNALGAQWTEGWVVPGVVSKTGCACDCFQHYSQKSKPSYIISNQFNVRWNINRRSGMITREKRVPRSQIHIFHSDFHTSSPRVFFSDVFPPSKPSRCWNKLQKRELPSNRWFYRETTKNFHSK
jgi:hypothetical protein